MFCARCGQQIPDASALCPLCGQEASLHLEPQAKVTAASPAPARISWPDEPQIISAPARRPDLRGVGGWLLFFCIALTVITPLRMLAQLAGNGFQLESAVDVALTAFGVLVGVMIWRVQAQAFVMLWIYFGISAALMVLGIVAVFINTKGEPPPQVIEMFRGLIFTVIWLLYFKKSDRVQATFGRNL